MNSSVMSHTDVTGDVLTVRTLYKNFPKITQENTDANTLIHGHYTDHATKKSMKCPIPGNLRKNLLAVNPLSLSLITHRLNRPNNPYGRIASTLSEYVTILCRFLIVVLLLGYSVIVLLGISYHGSYSSSHVSVELIGYFSYSLAISVILILPIASFIAFVWRKCL